MKRKYLEHQTLGQWVIRSSEPAYYIEGCRIFDFFSQTNHQENEYISYIREAKSFLSYILLWKNVPAIFFRFHNFCPPANLQQWAVLDFIVSFLIRFFYFHWLPLPPTKLELSIWDALHWSQKFMLLNSVFFVANTPSLNIFAIKAVLSVRKHLI